VFATLVLASFSALATVPRYVVGGVGDQRIVSDGVTGLVWQQQSTSDPTDWADALAHCENLSFAGHDDWRMPSVVELSTIVDEKKTQAPAINTTFFVGFEGTVGFWASTTARQSPSSAYVLYFNEMNATVGRGGTGVVLKTSNARALCVRGGEQ